ncbi:PREDICTED: zonadhesin-like, partial [Thamnophis sirtalis]|uniref:Zonadhesin-like n=1 Tax=Thamnophis sirtalis TaxID=35019 RepID=A0A6I9YBE8_9SAUR
MCFSFWYHMYGVAQKMALHFYVILDDAPPFLVWSETGSKGNRWKTGEFGIAHQGRVKILLEGVRGEDFRSDVAVDDISVQGGDCPSRTTSTPGPTTTRTPPTPSQEPTPTTTEPTTPEPTPTPTEPTTAEPEPTPSPTRPTVPAPSICTASGDPHYTTFDGQVHHFMGNCTYTLAKACSNSTRGLEAFDVSTTNEHRGSNRAVSYVHSVHVAVHGSQVSLLKNRKVNVNGTRRNLPVYIGGNKIVVRLSGSYVILITDFGLSVRFDGNHYVEVAMPAEYQGLLCGLCGNFNGNPGDDNLKPDGEPAGDSTQLGNSWLVPDNSSICSSPAESCDPKLEEEIQRNSACRLIADPTGPFGQCHALVDPARFLENCIYDVCLTQGQQTSVCHGLQAYAASCANAGLCVEWRNSTLCPVSCPVNSHYSSCGTSCPSSCVKPPGLPPCSPLPTDGCFCNEGFVLSGDTCVPEADCGCVDGQGNYYQVGFPPLGREAGRTRSGPASLAADLHSKGTILHTRRSIRTDFNIYAGELCEKPPGGQCLEGCVCHQGFVLSDDQCVPLSQCGCQDKDGRYHKIGESWLTPHCSQKCRCRKGGAIKCQDFGCEPGEVCDTKKDGKLHCKPTGFGNCLVTGDPHYLTFDGLLHHFQGLHTYVLAQTRPDASDRLEPLSIEGTNRLVAGSGQPSVLKELRIRVYNHTVLFRQRRKLVVDGVATEPPARPHEGLRIQQSGRQIFLESDFGLSVSFDGLENSGILLPNSYKRSLEGLCGNFDGRFKNDFAKPDGTLVKDVQTFGESWRVPVQRGSSHLRRNRVAEEPPEEAELDVGFSPLCSEEDIKVFSGNSACGILADPKGPFRGCLAHQDPDPFLQSCVFDMCREANRSARLCPILEQYAKGCQSKSLSVADWRAASGCAVQCQPHSHYNPCMSACPPSCSDLAAPASCSSPCLEGCECESGYVLSGFDCVPFRDCGCSFLGKYYKVGDRFMADDCSQDCVCRDSSSLDCKATGCPQDFHCRIFNFTRGCYQADPCEPNSCANNGTCVLDDSPDTFHCECLENYEGLLCETRVTPEADPCQPNPCLNNGICVRHNSS